MTVNDLMFAYFTFALQFSAKTTYIEFY